MVSFIYYFNLRKRFFICGQQSLFRIGPEETDVRDVVSLLYGGRAPYVLRPSANGNYLLIGECYLHDIMGGWLIVAIQAKAAGFNSWRELGPLDFLKCTEIGDKPIEGEWKVVLE